MENIEEDEEDDMNVEEEDNDTYQFGILKLADLIKNNGGTTGKFLPIQNFQSHSHRNHLMGSKIAVTHDGHVRSIFVPPYTQIIIERTGDSYSVVSKVTTRGNKQHFRIISDSPYCDLHYVFNLLDIGVLYIAKNNWENRERLLLQKSNFSMFGNSPEVMLLIDLYNVFVNRKTIDPSRFSTISDKSIYEFSTHLISHDPSGINETEKQHEELITMLRHYYFSDRNRSLQLQLLENALLFHIFIHLKSTNRIVCHSHHHHHHHHLHHHMTSILPT
jgi:hypothetical protein